MMRFLLVAGFLALYVFLSYVPSSGESPLKALLKDLGKGQVEETKESQPSLELRPAGKESEESKDFERTEEESLSASGSSTTNYSLPTTH